MLPSETELLERDIQNERRARAKARKERFADEPVSASWGLRRALVFSGSPEGPDAAGNLYILPLFSLCSPLVGRQ